MPHVTGHFCVCHVELWLLFHDFFPVPGYLGTWVPGYLGTWVPGYLGTWVPGYLGTKKAKNQESGLCDNVDYFLRQCGLRQCGLCDNVDY